MAFAFRGHTVDEDQTIHLDHIYTMLGSAWTRGQEGSLSAWARLNSHTGKITSLEGHHGSRPGTSTSEVQFCLDSLGRSHDRTQSGDLVVEFEGSSSAFIMSLAEKHFTAPDARWYTKNMSSSWSPEEQGQIDADETNLFLGTCSIYPGHSRHPPRDTYEPSKPFFVASPQAPLLQEKSTASSAPPSSLTHAPHDFWTDNNALWGTARSEMK
jgi:hypothetical protein